MINMAHRIRAAMNGMSVDELARRAHCSRSTIYRFLNDIDNFRLSTLQQIAQALGVPAGHLLAESDDKAEFMLRLHEMSHQELKALRRRIFVVKNSKNPERYRLAPLSYWMR